MNPDEFRKIVHEEVTEVIKPLYDKVNKIEIRLDELEKNQKKMDRNIKNIDLRKRIEILEQRTGIIHS